MKRTLTVDVNITIEDHHEGARNIVIRMKGDVGEDRVVEEHTGGSYYPVALTENWATVNGELLPNPLELDPQMLYLSERDTTDANKVFLIYRAKDDNNGEVAYRWIAVSLYEYASESGLSPDIWVIANTASVPVADSLTEKIAYRGEKGRELTVAEIDENFRKVANPWNPKRAYRSQDIVYEYDDDTQTCGWYMYYNINRDGTSLIGVRPSEYDNIPADMWIPVGGRGNGGGGGSDTPDGDCVFHIEGSMMWLGGALAGDFVLVGGDVNVKEWLKYNRLGIGGEPATGDDDSDALGGSLLGATNISSSDGIVTIHTGGKEIVDALNTVSDDGTGGWGKDIVLDIDLTTPKGVLLGRYTFQLISDNLGSANDGIRRACFGTFFRTDGTKTHAGLEDTSNLKELLNGISGHWKADDDIPSGDDTPSADANPDTSDTGGEDTDTGGTGLFGATDNSNDEIVLARVPSGVYVLIDISIDTTQATFPLTATYTAISTKGEKGDKGDKGDSGTGSPASNQNPYEYVAYKCFRVKNGHSGGIKFTFGTAEGVDFYNENLLPGSVNMAMCIKSAVPDWNNVFQTPTYSINQNVGIVSIPQPAVLDSDYVVRVCLYLYKDGDYEALFTFELFKDWESSGE